MKRYFNIDIMLRKIFLNPIATGSEMYYTSKYNDTLTLFDNTGNI